MEHLMRLNVIGIVSTVSIALLSVSSTVAAPTPTPCTLVESVEVERGNFQSVSGCTTEFTEDFDPGHGINITGWHKLQYMGDSTNLVHVVSNKAHSGKRSLGSYTASSPEQQKACLARQLLWFPAGSDFWFSGWYYINRSPTTENLFIFDLESTQGVGNPGRRIALGGPGGNYIRLDSKRAGEIYNQVDTLVPFPKAQWVNVKIHMYLSSGSDGIAHVWQDGVEIINRTGPNIPEGVFYDWVEVGITANTSGHSQVVFVDDVVISKFPIP
jgi:polysaccharide lyase-like protein